MNEKSTQEKAVTGEGVMDEARKWIAGHMDIAGITASKNAEQILAAIAKAEGSK